MEFSKVRQDSDGLNTLQYTILSTTTQPLYTHLYVSIDQDKIMARHSDIADALQASVNEPDHRLKKHPAPAAAGSGSPSNKLSVDELNAKRVMAKRKKEANDCKAGTVKNIQELLQTS